MRSNNITFVIFTFNEEARIARVIRNFVHAGKVLVVDNHSTDGTEEIARTAGATVLKHKNPGWVENDNTVSLIKATVDTPWIYWAFADEMIDQATVDVILAEIEVPGCSIVRIARKNYFYGVFCHDAFISSMNRVFRKDAIDFTGNEIHGFGRVTVPKKMITALDAKKHFVHHFISNTAKSYLGTIDRYTDIEPKRSGSRPATRIILTALKTFIFNYFVRKGYKAGLPGLFLLYQMILYEAVLNMKRFEVSENLTAANIEERNDEVREGLLRGMR